MAEKIKAYILIVLLLAGLLFLVVGVPYLQFRACRERFPEAPAWTFFFQGGRR